MALSRTLFAYVHAGNIEDAIKLCRDAHQSRRAATVLSSSNLRFVSPHVATGCLNLG